MLSCFLFSVPVEVEEGIGEECLGEDEDLSFSIWAQCEH